MRGFTRFARPARLRLADAAQLKIFCVRVASVQAYTTWALLNLGALLLVFGIHRREIYNGNCYGIYGGVKQPLRCVFPRDCILRAPREAPDLQAAAVLQK